MSVKELRELNRLLGEFAANTMQGGRLQTINYVKDWVKEELRPHDVAGLQASKVLNDYFFSKKK